MYELIIECDVCGAQRSTHGLDALPELNTEEVLAQAGHTPSCAVKRTGKGKVTQDTRQDSPNAAFYRIASEVS